MWFTEISNMMRKRNCVWFNAHIISKWTTPPHLLGIHYILDRIINNAFHRSWANYFMEKKWKRIWNYVADIEQSVHEECCINKNVIPQIFTWIYILYQVTMPQLLEKNQWKRLMKISNVGEAAFHLGKF